MKKILILVLAAGALIGAAMWLKDGRAQKTPNLVGRKILPAFNVADVAICAGVGLLLLHTIRCSRKKR